MAQLTAGSGQIQRNEGWAFCYLRAILGLMNAKSIYSMIEFRSMPAPLAEIWRITHQACAEWLPPSAKLHLSQIVGLEERRQKTRPLIGDAEKIQYWIDKNRFTEFSVSIVHKVYELFQISLRLRRSSIVSGPFGALFEIRCFEAPKHTRSWNNIIEGIMGRSSAVRGSQYDWDYVQWQSIEVSSLYQELIGSIPMGFKRYRTTQAHDYSPGLEMLDISLNPGRRVNPGRKVSAKEVISSLVTAETWLGPDFWEGAACTKAEVLAADFFLEVRDEPGFLYLKCWPHAFNRPDGEQGRVQQKLWRLLYKKDCEWPPGSGGIAETPEGELGG